MASIKKQTLQKIIVNGGATIAKNGESVTFSRGYQVSKKDCYTLKVKNAGRIVRKVNRIMRKMGAKDFCGLWVECGKVYVDVSEKIENRAEALRVGRERGQISVFDWQNKTCIYC